MPQSWSGLSCPPPGDLPHPGMGSALLTAPALAVGFFTISATWEAPSLPYPMSKKERESEIIGK